MTQSHDDKPTKLTTDFGAPVPDNQNSLTAGPRGPLLAQDVWLHEKLVNLVPGISVSPDKMLQARLFNYADAQRYRLGVNYHQIPVNAARCPVHSNHRDGQGRVDGNYGGRPHYEPNSFHQWQEQPEFREPPLKVSGDADWWNFRDDDSNYYKQPGDPFRLMTPAQQQALFENTARAMGDAPEFIKRRHVENCAKADPAYGAGVSRSLGL